MTIGSKDNRVSAGLGMGERETQRDILTYSYRGLIRRQTDKEHKEGKNDWRRLKPHL